MPSASKNAGPKAGSKPSSAAEREQRLAAALRENLRKRKAQQRGRVDSDAPAAAGTRKPDAGQPGE
ncbi:hypothetical protein HBA54_19770 [Pelagibius litoralis]|uniref:Uncharacterized protein n=1 Tax=Pelagibius litoralis TaxID=374515 RepID=A0A967KB36_9PROT|nr:hypothetical protein [Pelagibius litoralis]NIA70842.1 hypothetical protein [Pelagibius litoralis]